MKGDEIFSSNLELLCRKDPSFTLSLLGYSPYPLVKRKDGYDLTIKKKFLYGDDNFLSSHEEYWHGKLLSDIKHLYVWGLGLGYSFFPIASWLKENSNRFLHFLEEDPRIVLSFLHLKEAKDILMNDQVNLTLFSLEDQDFPVQKEKAALFSSPHKKDKKKEKELQESLSKKITLEEGVFLDRSYSYIHFSHFIQNYPLAKAAFFPHKWKNTFKGMPAILCGAGPSLELAKPLLEKAEDKALIFAGGSAISALSSMSLRAHFAMALDPNQEEYTRLKPALFPDTPFLFTFRTYPDVFDLIESPLGYMKSAMGQVVDLWCEERWGEEDPLIGDDLSENAMSVTTLLLSFISFLGCDPIIFAGVDLAYVKKQRYAKGVGLLPKDMMEKERNLDDERFLIDGKKGKVESSTRWLMEIDCISDFAVNHPNTSFIDASPEGAKIPNVPFLSFEEIESRFLTKSWDITAQIHGKISLEETIDPKLHKEAIDILIASLIRCMEYVKKIADHLSVHEEISGKAVLYELELEEEIAYQVIFYDTRSLLQKRCNTVRGTWKELFSVLKRFARICEQNSKAF